MSHGAVGSAAREPPERDHGGQAARPFVTGQEIQDIEELADFGKRNSVCPYYLSRQRSSADIFFMPYNYLVDPNVRATLSGMQWQDAIVICDEAHNLEQVCADASSFELRPEVIANAIEECDACIFMLSQSSEPGGDGVALDLAVSAGANVYTLMGKEVDADGNIIDPIRCDWTPGGVFVTPPGWWHSHHNESDETAWVLPMQDAGLYTHQRTLDIRFVDDELALHRAGKIRGSAFTLTEAQYAEMATRMESGE